MERKYVYAGRAWYLFSREHNVFKKEPEFLERQHLHVVQPTMCPMLSVYDTPPQ